MRARKELASVLVGEEEEVYMVDVVGEVLWNRTSDMRGESHAKAKAEQLKFLKLLADQFKYQSPDSPLTTKDVLDATYQMNFFKLASDVAAELRDVGRKVTEIEAKIRNNSEDGSGNFVPGQYFSVDSGSKGVALAFDIEAGAGREVKEALLSILNDQGNVVASRMIGGARSGVNEILLEWPSDMTSGRYHFEIKAMSFEGGIFSVKDYASRIQQTVNSSSLRNA